MISLNCKMNLNSCLLISILLYALCGSWSFQHKSTGARVYGANPRYDISSRLGTYVGFSDKIGGYNFAAEIITDCIQFQAELLRHPGDSLIN